MEKSKTISADVQRSGNIGEKKKVRLFQWMYKDHGNIGGKKT